LKGSYIYFNKDVFNEGNAVVSLADAENHIVWSWHIWSTDEPQFIEINGQLWMDRNMGATDTTAGSLTYMDYGTIQGIHFLSPA